ncbi:hypothetical protein [Microvirga terrestris]|uniref:Uncharacterized protein n=1 Tax=Microvirga terrestris TaxID=2791024 RepID=A0ABS0HP85_9HYPH|nr:hypothetical protein [Microvirga terrestris]MBF9195020.1 hypothetical protein [Microvirga terrestris]
MFGLIDLSVMAGPVPAIPILKCAVLAGRDHGREAGDDEGHLGHDDLN